MAVFSISRLHVLLLGFILVSPMTVSATKPACPTITSTAIQPYCPSSTEGCFFPQIIELATVTVPCGCPRVPATSTSYLPCPTQDCFFITPTSWETEYDTCTPTKRTPVPTTISTSTVAGPPCTCPPGVFCNCLLPTPTPTPTPPPGPDPRPAYGTCTTVATTGGPELCTPLEDCITLACLAIETATLSCGCDEIFYTSTCQTSCTGGCGATQWNTLTLPCPTGI